MNSLQSLEYRIAPITATNSGEGQGPRPLEAAPGEWKLCAALVLLLGLAYLLTYNGLWHPGPDTSYYIGIARSLAEGQGFKFNGQPVGKVPPLWPLVLAGAMKISRSFAFLNLVPLVCHLGSVAMWYWVVRRTVAPAASFLIVLLSGMIFFWYTAATELRTEPLFSLAMSGALLLALQSSERGGCWWRMAAAALLCGVMVATRWAGVAAWLPVAAALLGGQRLWPRPANRSWAGAALVAVVAVGSFYGIRWALTADQMTREEYKQLVAQGGATNGSAFYGGGGLAEDLDAPPIVTMQAVIPNEGPAATLRRVLDGGKWLSSFLFMPAYLGVTSPTFSMVTNPVGWVLIFFCVVVLWTEGKARRWMWIGVMLYCGFLVARWKVANPRYLVPVGPLLVLGCWLGMRRLAEQSRTDRWAMIWRGCAAVFLAALGLSNGALWAVDVFIARSGDFYGYYQAGEMDKLIAAAKYLNDRGLKDGEVAVSVHYVNLGRVRPNGAGLRSLHVLTDRGIRSVPRKICTDEPNEQFVPWAVGKGVRYYLYRPPVSPWRAHHFRIGWVQRWQTGEANIPENPSWRLYELSGDKFIEIQLPHVANWPDRVPG